MHYSGNINSKLPQVGTTIFSIMTALANEHKAVNLSQGFPDFSPPEKLIDKVHEYMQKGMNQYAPMPGLITLREALAEKYEKLYSQPINPDTEISITAGGTQALFTAIQAVVREGDEVILFEPAYDSYTPAIELAGGKPIYAQLEFPEYKINWSQLKKLVNQKTRMIIINSPHNPSGTCLNAFDMMQLEKITQGSDIIILSDEVYEHMVYDGQQHQSVLRYPKLAERSMVCFSFGKTYHNTGWKVGYCIAPENLMNEFRKVHQFVVFSVSTATQYALSDYVKNNEDYLQLASFYQEKRDYVRAALKNTGWKLLTCTGTYFQSLAYDKISAEDDVHFTKRLVTEHGIALIPVSVFYHKPEAKHVVRLCFAKNRETLDRGIEKLLKISKP